MIRTDERMNANDPVPSAIRQPSSILGNVNRPQVVAIAAMIDSPIVLSHIPSIHSIRKANRIQFILAGKGQAENGVFRHPVGKQSHASCVGSDFPNTHRSIMAARGQSSATGRKHQSANPVSVPSHHRDTPAIRRVEQTDRMIVACNSDMDSISSDSHRGNDR
jgi:hypothetical protein